LSNAHDKFILDTDASDTAIGAELLQIKNGEERVIAYHILITYFHSIPGDFAPKKTDFFFYINHNFWLLILFRILGIVHKPT
jgi:hypothetical protein